MGGDERRYLLVRAIQFFLPGVPQVYYVGFLAGRNDMELLARTGVGRDINRHYYSSAEIEAGLKQPVVKDLLGLIRFRNTHPAFGGTFQLIDSDPAELAMRWDHAEHFAELRVNLAQASHQLTCSEVPGMDRPL